MVISRIRGKKREKIIFWKEILTFFINMADMQTGK